MTVVYALGQFELKLTSTESTPIEHWFNHSRVNHRQFEIERIRHGWRRGVRGQQIGHLDRLSGKDEDKEEQTRERCTTSEDEEEEEACERLF